MPISAKILYLQRKFFGRRTYAGARLTETFIKSLHKTLKSNTSGSRRAWFAVGDYKRLPNEVGL